MPTLPTTSLKLDGKLKSRLQKLAEARRRSAHWLMRDAIEQYVEREELHYCDLVVIAPKNASARAKMFPVR